MVEGIRSPAESTYWLIQGRVLFLAIHLLGLACFSYIVAKRLRPLLRGQADFRFDRPRAKTGKSFPVLGGAVETSALPGGGHPSHPRFRGFPSAGNPGFLADSWFLRQLLRGHSGRPHLRDGQRVCHHHCFCLHGGSGDSTAGLQTSALCGASEIWESAIRPTPYFLLGLIAILMLADSVFDASQGGSTSTARPTGGIPGAPRHCRGLLNSVLVAVPFRDSPEASIFGSYLAHDADLLLPAVLSAVRNSVSRGDFAVQLYFAKLDRGTLKPVRWGVSDRATRSGEIVSE